MNETGLRRIPPDQSSGSAHTVGTSRYPSVIDPILSKRVCFYKSGDPQFNGLLLVINNRTFKTFDTLLDSLSKKVPLPFGVRNITTPRGVHAINTLDELEDGKSYICSDSRKVKPINLALARKKLPPWYHARPLSSRRRTEQQARLERGLMRTPKRLLVFRNGDPTVKHTVVLHKKNTPSYESIREYISELMQFHVVKLHTTDGRRVDGLPGLILCSGTVVAVGREPFRPAIYRAWKSPPSTWQHSNRTGLRRYIVHQIHDTIAKRSCDMPSHPTNSAELESNHRLESVAETEGDTCDGAERQDCSPNQDDIEKSFRVNHDGSMTVEMRVRLTVKEEETIHWTTTLSRSSVANQLTSTRLPEPDAEQIQICSPQQNSPDLQSPVSSIDTINKDKTKDDSDDDPPSLGNGALTESSAEEEDIKDQSHVAYPRRPPTPGYEQVSKKQTSVESIRSMTADGIQEGMVGSYAYIEQTENETMTEQYCMIKQSSSKPIPKPRRLGSFDVNSQNVSSFKSAGMSEILQTESSGEEICYSIKSIRQITQNKRPSCLEKSNSLPDFSSHVASTFGSSSKALLAFLSIMTLKEDMTNLNINELNANSVSCAEALKMINSLIEIASIEDAHKLKASLLSLQQSASKQLLHSWKGFQELGDRCRSRSSTPNCSEHELMTSPEQSYDSEENFINELMDNLYIPEKLKEEIASFSVGTKSESDDEEKMSARIIERAELSPKEISDEDASHLSTEGVCDVTQNEKANADVRSIIKQFTDINQPKQSVMDSSYLITKTAKHKPPGQTAKDNDDQHGQNGATKCPPAEIPEERQPYGTTSCVQESGQDLQSCSDAVHEDSQEEQQGHDDDKLSEERANINRAVSSEKIIEKCSFKTEEKDMECGQLQTQSEGSMSIPENELTPSEESGSDEEGQRTSSANEDLEEKESSEQSVSSSEAGRRPSSEEEESEVACEEIKQESSEVEASSNPESHSEEEEEKQPSSNFYAELTAGGKESLSSPDQFLSEEEQPEIEFNDLSSKVDLSSPVRVSNVDKEQQRVTFSMGLSDSVDESTGDSDKVEQSSSEDCSRLQVIVEESSSGLEEEQEEEHLHVLSHDAKQTEKCKDLTTLIEVSEEDEVTSGDEGKTHICEKTKTQITISSDLSTGNQDSYTKKDNSRLIKPDGLSKGYRFNADVDSGNGHSSSGEHVVEEQSKVGDEQISSSVQENLSCYEKKSSSVDEKVNVERYLKESRTQYQETLEKSEVTQCEMAVEKLKHQSQKIVSQSVAERVILLEKQVADAQKIKSSTARRLSHKNNPLEPEDSSAEAPTSQLDLCTRSAPQSSLSFSYDCSGGITTEPEPNRVKSIREMFLAKSATDVQQRCFPNPNVTNPSAVRAETSVSGGYESQTSSEPSSGEEDTARKNITKGFVRRTIDRLYGKKDADADPDEEALEGPPSEPKQKKKEPSSIFSPFNAARAKALSELSYFNSTHALDTLTEATRCIAFNAQVGPGDSVPIDSGRWVFRENMLIRKSVSDPIGINKIFTNTPEGEGMLKDTEENTPFSLFSAKSELEKQAKSISEKCTYFSLPHASDSDVCEDEPSAVSNSSASDSVTEAKDNSEDTKIWAERNGKLPGVSVSDFRMMDNKVHPLIEPTLEGEVVVVQPGKGHGIVNRRLQEPDLLDFVYNFCGQHCPIL
ncbi:oxygen-regulated protein 1-like [Embiotoca jacksoni]|uniref:oxygen-regulated protein 1-like n=1 Tax=Embiotoca jacksoni TaxID=100190 RepID=UPI003703960C